MKLAFVVLIWIIQARTSFSDEEDTWERVLSVWNGRRDSLNDMLNSLNQTPWTYENTPAQNHFMSGVFKTWNYANVSQVMVTVVKDNAEVAFLIFDAFGSNYKNWFSQARLIASSFELDTASFTTEFTFRSEQGLYDGLHMMFLIDDSVGLECTEGSGWLMVLENEYGEGECTHHNTRGVEILYSPYATSASWERTATTADQLSVFIQRDGPCKSGINHTEFSLSGPENCEEYNFQVVFEIMKAAVEVPVVYYTKADVKAAAITIGTFTGVIAVSALAYVMCKDFRQKSLPLYEP